MRPHGCGAAGHTDDDVGDANTGPTQREALGSCLVDSCCRGRWWVRLLCIAHFAVASDCINFRISPQTRGESVTFLHGPGAAVVGLQRDVARLGWRVAQADLRCVGCRAGRPWHTSRSRVGHRFIARSSSCRSWRGRDIAPSESRSNQCTRATNNARGRLLMVDAALGQRVAQLHGTR